MNRTDELRTKRTTARVTHRPNSRSGIPMSLRRQSRYRPRRRIEKILNGEDPRLLVVIAPRSIYTI